MIAAREMNWSRSLQCIQHFSISFPLYIICSLFHFRCSVLTFTITISIGKGSVVKPFPKENIPKLLNLHTRTLDAVQYKQLFTILYKMKSDMLKHSKVVVVYLVPVHLLEQFNSK